jgi:glyoxylase-like metal-dependent hydrolase (beta-lactamase superfamily II)/rhodanese-related sulfurtransferase
VVFRQITHDDLGCASYLVGDDDAGVGAVVDPRFEIDEYLELARYLGVSIEHVLETHTHADHVSGHGRLASATGATIHVHAQAGAEYDHEPFEDGWVLELGAVRVEAVHTPGHRPEHTAFLISDTDRGDEPWAVLTGDSLFVGDIARPDLAIDKEDGARGIFRSLHERLLVLAPEVEVWPGHLGGSMCGGPGMDMKVSSTIGFERRHNELLAVDSEEAFVERSLARLGPQPPNFQTIVELNRGPLLTDGVEAHPLTPRQVDQHRQDGAMLVDVRTDEQFDDAHIPGSVCLSTLRAGFGTKLAWVIDRGDEIVIIGRHDGDARVAAGLAAAVGVRRIAGFLSGGMTTWRQEHRVVDRTERVRIENLADVLEARPEVQLLDVRERAEFDDGHIPGSLHTAYHDLHELPADIDPARPVAAVCSSGQRSAVAASLLRRLGVEEVLHVAEGGVPAWARAGRLVQSA